MSCPYSTQGKEQLSPVKHQTSSEDTITLSNDSNVEEDVKVENTFIDDKTIRKFEQGDIYWRRLPVVELVAKKLTIWLFRFHERHGRRCIDWNKDVMPVLALDKQVHMARGWHSIPHAKHLATTIMHPKSKHRPIRDMIKRLMSQGIRPDVFLYAVLTNAAARIGDGEMAWQGLRRLAWLEAIPTNNFYTHVIQRLTLAHEIQEQQKVPLRTAPVVENTKLREITELEQLVMHDKSVNCRAVFIDRAPHWIEKISIMMKEENELDNGMTATCQLVACVCNGGRPALNEHVLARITKLIEDSVDENTLEPSILAVWKFEKLYAELLRNDLIAVKPVHSRILNMLLNNYLLDYAMAWHLRLARSIKWIPTSPSLAVTFSIGQDKHPDSMLSAKTWYQLDELNSSLQTASSDDVNTLPSYLDSSNRLLIALIRAKRFDEAVLVYDDLIRLNAIPDHYTLCSIAFCCAMAGNDNYLIRVFKDFKRFNLPVNIIFYNGLLSVMVKQNHQPAIRQFYTQIIDLKLTPNRRTIHLLLESCAKIGDTESALYFYKKMLVAGISPITRTFAHLLDVYARHANVNGAIQVMKEMQRQQVPLALPVINALLSIYARSANSMAAKRCLQLMLAQPITSKLRPNVISYLWLFRAYYWATRRRHHTTHNAHQYTYLQMQSFVTTGNLTYSASTLEMFKAMSIKTTTTEPPVLPVSLEQIPMQSINDYDATVLPDMYFDAVNTQDNQPAIDTPWQLFRCMTIHDGLTPNSLIYDTLFATLAIDRLDVEFKFIWCDLNRRAQLDSTLTNYAQTLRDVLAKEGVVLQE
jgi:pentatricopeptide repeat protein